MSEPRTNGPSAARRSLPAGRLGDRRSWIVAAAALLALGAIVLAGAVLPVGAARPLQPDAVTVGRSGSVCTVGTQPSGPGAGPSPNSSPNSSSSSSSSPSSSPSSSSSPGSSSSASASPSASTPADGDTTVTAVAARVGTPAAGTLTGRLLGDSGSQNALDITTQGDGDRVERASGTVLLDAQGSMASTSAGAVYTRAEAGENRGIALAPCVVPAVNQWLTGLGARDDLRSDIVLTNPDSSEAEVDLRIFGVSGPVVAAGASGLTIPAGGSRVVSLDTLAGVQGPVAVNVRASVGRVAAVAHDVRSNVDTPAGSDYHPASAAPATRQVIPAVPAGNGARTLTVVNPGQQRTTVRIDILGPEGPFAPAGAATLDVGAQSTASIDVSAGLAGQIGTLAISSPQPVTAAVQSVSERNGAADDIAVSTAQPAIGGIGVAPVAIAADMTSELALSNGADSPVTANLEIFDLDGVSLYSEDIPLGPNATAARRLTQPAPAYLVVKVPQGSSVYAGGTLAETDGDVAGLASAALVTPDLAGRAPIVQPDPGVAR